MGTGEAGPRPSLDSLVEQLGVQEDVILSRAIQDLHTGTITDARFKAIYDAYVAYLRRVQETIKPIVDSFVEQFRDYMAPITGVTTDQKVKQLNDPVAAYGAYRLGYILAGLAQGDWSNTFQKLRTLVGDDRAGAFVFGIEKRKSEQPPSQEPLLHYAAGTDTRNLGPK